ncbi:MAG: DNA-directed RNA polymerase subunit omega [Bacillota bacterium]|jgi:DNA-directed RNA polymerase omega subunit
MMNKPYIDELSQKGESRYTLIAVAAKRARQITEDNPELSRSGAINPVSQALHEINDDKLRWHHRNAEAVDVFQTIAMAGSAVDAAVAEDTAEAVTTEVTE